MRYCHCLLFVGLLFLFGCESKPAPRTPSPPPLPPQALPLQHLDLTDFSGFQAPGNNWKTGEDVYADPQVKHAMEISPGSGVIANVTGDTDKSHLFTQMEHGDLELEIDFLMPKGSNSGLYFQGRYEIQLFDSWGKDPVRHSDCGGIYQRWDPDRTEGKRGYEGHPPRINASRAPGLWQHFKVLFRAPRFDAQGNKTENARFEKVYHNGVLIHDNVEVTGPTRSAAFEDEVPQGPLMIQGDHGPVAIRNFRYKTFGEDSLRLENLTYQLFESPGDRLPSFDTLTMVKEGAASSLQIADASTLKDHFALRFRGDLIVPTTGDYLFKTVIDDGGDLIIDGNLVVHNEGSPGVGTESAIVRLTEGKHTFEMTYYQEVWSANLVVFYEGPEIPMRTLATSDPSKSYKAPPPLIISSGSEVEMVRGFVMYKGEKRTHTISIGSPEGVHYSYDLLEGALLNFWKGGFGDVTKMWYRRGHDQLLVPLNAAVEGTSGITLATLKNEDDPWPESIPSTFSYQGYTIQEKGTPVYSYTYDGITMTDKITPSQDAKQPPVLTRRIEVKAEQSRPDMWYRIASGDKIELLPTGQYRIDGKYYLYWMDGNGQEPPVIRISESGQELIVPVLTTSSTTQLTYDLSW